MKQQIDQKAAEPKKKRTAKKDQAATKNSVTIPYLKGLSEILTCVFCCHCLATSMKAHETLRNMLVHPKGKCDVRDTVGVVCQIHSKDCPKIYMG